MKSSSFYLLSLHEGMGLRSVGKATARSGHHAARDCKLFLNGLVVSATRDCQTLLCFSCLFLICFHEFVVFIHRLYRLVSGHFPVPSPQQFLRLLLVPTLSRC